MSAALATAEVSPVPKDVVVDRSAGIRAHVTWHAIRRYVERGPFDLAEEVMLGKSDVEAMGRMRELGLPVDGVEARLAYYGGVCLRYGANALIIDGVGLVVQGRSVVTVLRKRRVR